MIKIEINPARIERVVLDGRSQLEQQLDDAAYRAICPLIKKIDQRLRTIARESFREREPNRQRVAAE